VHELPIQRFVCESGAVEQLPEVIRQCAPDIAVRRVAIVADARTWDVCGRAVHAVLKGPGFEAESIIVDDTNQGGPVCDDVAVEKLIERLRATRPEMVIAVGSGTVNDLCKWASFELDLPYVVVATAASMNGYAAANVAPQIAGVKVLVRARPPLAVVAEPRVIKNAPFAMTAAGFGDTVARCQSTTDWIANHLLLEEYYCPFCAGIVGTLEPLYLERPEDLVLRKSTAIGGLFEALFWSGVAMTLVGTSAPASGGEHLLSHTLDMTAHARGHGHDLHGRQVGVGTIVSAALYERILEIESPQPVSLPEKVDEGFWARSEIIRAVTEQYQAKADIVRRVRQQIGSGGLWDTLRSRLAETVKAPGVVRDWLNRAGGATSAADVDCSREHLKAAMLHMHEIRRRFTVVDLAWMTGVFPAAADEIIDRWLDG
jgi:glycerol-1-phosphate dehydrogenase [NAD(P)+]